MTAQIQELLDADMLDEAIAALNAEVRANPMDIDRRVTLAELLCIAGNLERADTILNAVSDLDPGAAVGVSLFRQLVRGEQARQQYHLQGSPPAFLARPDPISELEMRAALLLRNGDAAGAAELIEQRDAARAPVSGEADGVAFEDLRDLDDLSAGHFEVLTSTGKYYWIPTASVISIEFRAPERRRDLIWRRAGLSVADGPDGEVYMPCTYQFAASTPAQKLGHITDFNGEEGAIVQAAGLRSFLVGDDCKTVLELGAIRFGGHAGD
jgi:type VI secretion system protein ImpE